MILAPNFRAAKGEGSKGSAWYAAPTNESLSWSAVLFYFFFVRVRIKFLFGLRCLLVFIYITVSQTVGFIVLEDNFKMEPYFSFYKAFYG